MTLYWTFINGHEWSKSFDTVNDIENYVHLCGMLTDYAIEKVWYDTDNGDVWLREKN